MLKSVSSQLLILNLLTLDELLYAGTLTDSKDDKIAIYKKSCRNLSERLPSAYNKCRYGLLSETNVAEAEKLVQESC